MVTCLQAVQNFLWKNSSFIWIPTAEQMTERISGMHVQHPELSVDTMTTIIIIIITALFTPIGDNF